jgi:hypothetical protein
MKPVHTIGIANGGGSVVCLKGGKIDSVTLDEALEKMKYVHPGCECVHAARAAEATFGDSA